MDSFADRYGRLLQRFFDEGEESVQTEVASLARDLIREKNSPEDVVSLHRESVAGMNDPVRLRDSFRFLQLLMRIYGIDPLGELVQASVTTSFVARILRDLEGEVGITEVGRMRVGARYAQDIEGNLQNFLDMFHLQGLGRLAFVKVDPEAPSLVFYGEDLFESWGPSAYPQDHFTRGFLATVISRLLGEGMNCEEVACQAQGDPRCRFVVSPVRADSVIDLSLATERVVCGERVDP